MPILLREADGKIERVNTTLSEILGTPEKFKIRTEHDSEPFFWRYRKQGNPWMYLIYCGRSYQFRNSRFEHAEDDEVTPWDADKFSLAPTYVVNTRADLIVELERAGYSITLR